MKLALSVQCVQSAAAVKLQQGSSGSSRAAAAAAASGEQQQGSSSMATAAVGHHSIRGAAAGQQLQRQGSSSRAAVSGAAAAAAAAAAAGWKRQGSSSSSSSAAAAQQRSSTAATQQQRSSSAAAAQQQRSSSAAAAQQQQRSSSSSSSSSAATPVASLSPDDPILIDQGPAPSSIRRGHKTAMTEAKQKELQAKYQWCRFSGGCNERGPPQAHCSTCLEHKPNSSLFAKASGGGGAVTCEAELAQHAKSKAHSEAIGMAQRAGGGASSIKAAVKAATTTVVKGTYRHVVLAALFMVLWGHSAMSFPVHLQFATHSGAPAMPHDFNHPLLQCRP
ncbi:hypothetical protein QJQ45_015290 [Haematococcus lacustris]|nr:hypothetical protein QJQ45_015290 [Haematococcus lacustris]